MIDASIAHRGSHLFSVKEALMLFYTFFFCIAEIIGMDSNLGFVMSKDPFTVLPIKLLYIFIRTMKEPHGRDTHVSTKNMSSVKNARYHAQSKMRTAGETPRCHRLLKDACRIYFHKMCVVAII